MYEVYITPLVINSPGGGHTQTYRHLRTETILINQVRAGHVPDLKTQKDAYPLPLPDKVQDELAGAAVFPTLDLQ